MGVNGTWTTIEVRGRFRSDSAAARNEAAALGLGINLAPLWQVRSLLDEGRLDLLLIEHEPPPVLLHLVWPSGQIMARRTRVVADLLASRLREAVVSA